MKKIIILSLIFVIVFLVGCSHADDELEVNPDVSSKFPAPGFENVPEAIVVDSIPEDEIKEFNIIAKKWSFEPGVIEVRKGNKVKLNINSMDVDHGISLIDFGVNENLASGKTTIVEFTASKSGEFTFFCSVYCGSGHKDMKGTLIVNE